MVEIVIFSWCLAITIIAYSVTRADEVWVVYNIATAPGSKVSILIVTYIQEDAIEYLNLYNKNNKESAWLTKKIVY